ncbi:SET domain-containing protein 5 [Hypsizygus marmoreus]|uniref:SET domain-containing protein 5 n=1 Tax=Hypsizygus marmoreus TaxID=39966 RepID=A0A369JLV0_HYPMA|nr:SET domain-containing protein 5 [Hypsizygus marmoreus]
MPSLSNPTHPKGVSTKRRSLPPSPLPPDDVCAEINAQVRSNAALGAPAFDFGAHVRTRSYALHDFHLDEFKVVAFLDDGVAGLLPETFRPPSPCPLYTFDIDNAGKKGLGMFALRNIPKGGLILVEHPILVVPYLVGLTTPLAEIYTRMFDRLTLEGRHELTRLANSESRDHPPSLEDVVHANAIGIQLDVPDVPNPELATHRAVFLNTSRCNHSCGPNAQWEWDTPTLSLYLSAVRPICPGEEITIQYAPSTRPRHERQKALRAQYGFTCQCQWCSVPSAEAVLRSDGARAALDGFWRNLPAFEEWCLDPTMSDDTLIKLHLGALEMIEQEGLQVLDREKHVDAIAMCYGALEDVERFKTWTARVCDAKVRENPSQALVFSKWLSNPMTFPAWGWRKTFCGSRARV